MIPNVLHLLNFSQLIYPFSILIGGFLGLFLFWRAGRRELYESERILDIFAVCVVGGLIFGRLFEFLFNFERFKGDFLRIIYLNTFSGIDLYGLLSGFLIFGMIFIKKRAEFFRIFDLAAAPISFSLAIISLGRFYSGLSTGNAVNLKIRHFLPTIGERHPIWFYYFIGYLVIFFLLKRLEKKKRHVGFFAGVFLILVSGLDLALFHFRGDITKVGVVSYQLAAPAVALIVGGIFWYALAKRDLRGDVKSFFALELLSAMFLKRLVTSVNEAGKVSRAIVLSPYYLLRSFFVILRKVVREIIAVVLDLAVAFGIKK